MRLAFSLCLLGAFATTCFAQSIPYLEPDSYRPVATLAKARLSRVSGDRVSHMFVLSPEGRTNLDDFSDEAFRLPSAGGVMMGCQFADITVDAKEAGKWLRELGMMSRVALETTISRSASTLLRTGVGGDSSTASRSGMMTEIRALADPTLWSGGDIGFRFYGHQQEVVRGATFRATHVESKETYEVISDQAGVANFTVLKPGTWRILAFALQEADTSPHLSISTLTFQITGGKS